VELLCPYSAKKIYLDRVENDSTVVAGWPMSVVCDIEDHPGNNRVFATTQIYYLEEQTGE
jgi:hypothetical protein